MRRLALTLGALAFLWACAATTYLLFASSQAGIARAAMLAAGGGAAPHMPPPLATATGVWVTGLLVGVTYLAGMPLGIALAVPAGQRMVAWTTGFVLLGFCAVSGFSVGLPYLPSALLLVVAGAVDKVEPQGRPFAGSRA